MLGPIDLSKWIGEYHCYCGYRGFNCGEDKERKEMCCPECGGIEEFAFVENSGFLSNEEKHPFDSVILGGETGPGARPMHPDWVRSVRDQCAAAGVPFFLKNMGEWVQCVDEQDVFNHKTGDFETIPAANAFIRKKAGRLLDGRTHDDLPWLPKGATS